ncbi:MAG TPA: potassium channel protein [Actinomycetes bacterium]|jgi:voltage-gated potassium channel|nr:potassium channel protein [Actinomycetes bacterium]
MTNRRFDLSRFGIARRPPQDRILARFRLPLALLVAVTVYGVAGYRVLEGWSLLDALYMTVITLSTAGFREVHPLSVRGQAFTISLILGGVAALFVSLGVVTELVVSGTLARVLKRRRMDIRISRLDRHYVICAYGRVGRSVAEELARQGLPFVVIEPLERLIAALEDQDAPYIAGDPTAEEVLYRAGIERAQSLVCAVDSDAANVYITLTARALNPNLVIVARASDPSSVDKLLRAGADQVVSPYALSGRRMAFLAQHPAVVDFLDLMSIVPDLRLEQIVVRAGSVLDCTTVAEASTAHGDATILAVKPATGDPIPYPRPEVRLAEGDRVVVLGPLQALDAMAR